MTIQSRPRRRPRPCPPSSSADAAVAAWWHRAIFYENHMASFRDGNGDGVGDLAGLTDSLDYLAELGVGAIWLSPCFRSPMLDQGFDITDHCQIDPLFGSLADFDTLLDQAHARDIRIIADYVPNHTSDQHPWFVASRSSRTDAKRNWYVWRDARPDGSPPNNWTSEAGGSVWQWDDATGQFYLHSHLVAQPDLNWREPAVAEAMFDVLRFWLGRGVDGFRIDVAHMLMKDPEFRDNPVRAAAADNVYDLQHLDFAGQFHVHDRMHPDVHQVLRRIRQIVDEYPGTVLIGEIEAMGWADWAGYYGAELDEIQLPFAFRLLETPWRPDAIAAELAALYDAVPGGAWPILALGNHDRPRLASRIPAAQLRVAAMLLCTLRGTPIIFYGDELGLPDQDVARERQRDYFGMSPGGVSRDPIRTPMPWDDSPNAGFSPAAEAELWLPISTHASELNVQNQSADPDSLLCLYRALIAERRSSPALLLGDIRLGRPRQEAADGCLVYERRGERECRVVALNFTDRPATMALPEPATVVLSTHGLAGVRAARGSIELRANEGVLLDVDASQRS